MRLTFLCAVSLLVANLWSLERPRTIEPRSLDDHTALLDPIQIDNLTVIPIVALGGAADDGTLSLDEATAEHWLSISEIGEGRVEAVQFANGADVPVFLLAGELVIGGKQDRIVATSTVVPPHASQSIAVRCVEHGRWSGTSTLTSAGRLAHDHLRGAAAYARQEDVWEEVQRITREHFTPDSYRTLAELQPASVRSMELQLDTALAALDDRDRMIGYVVAYNGNLAAIDRFRTPALARKLERKLLRSYIAEAIEQRIQGEPARPPCIHAVRDFIDNADRGQLERMFSTTISRTMTTRGIRSASTHVELGDREVHANYLGNVRAPDATPIVDWRQVSAPAVDKLYVRDPDSHAH